jgi:hypothetical protein
LKANKLIGLKAFTIVELAVNLLISSLVIGFIVSSFLVISKLHNSHKAKSEKLLKDEKLRYLLNKDVFEADFIFKTDNGFELKSNKAMAQYVWKDSLFIRNFNEKKDTFIFNDLNLALKFENQDVSYKQLIDEISLRSNNLNFITLQKEYALKELMNQEITYGY